MKTTTGVISLLILAAFAVRADHDADGPRQRISMDLNWFFTRGDPIGAQGPAFDDSGWRMLDVPHDWFIEGPYSETNSIGSSDVFLPVGIGWYQKRITRPTSFSDKEMPVQFDDIFMNAAIAPTATRVSTLI